MAAEAGSFGDSSRRIVEKVYKSKVPELPSYYSCGNSEQKRVMARKLIYQVLPNYTIK
jgi:hypothetical protein